jgi:hypothetical protein
LEDPVTKAVHHLLSVWEAERKEEWAEGGFLHEASHAQTVANARAIGNIEICKAIRTLDAEQLLEE